MGAPFLAAVLFAVIVVVILVRSIVVVPKDQAFVIERLGRFDRVLAAGLHIVPPFISRVSARVPLSEESIDVPSVSSPLRTGSEASVRGMVTFRVTDPALAVSAVADYRAALAGVASVHWREAVAASDHLSVIDRVRETEAGMRDAVAAWGMAIAKTQPVITLGPDALRALETQAAQEQDRRVAAWAVERRQRLGPDGRPTEAQRAAYREWLDLEVRVHADEIEEARRRERDSPS